MGRPGTRLLLRLHPCKSFGVGTSDSVNVVGWQLKKVRMLKRKCPFSSIQLLYRDVNAHVWSSLLKLQLDDHNRDVVAYLRFYM